MTNFFRLAAFCLILLPFLIPDPLDARSAKELEAQYDKHAFRAVPRDGFPVPNNPEMVGAEEADAKLRENQWVIGIEKNGEAQAYPVSSMGIHELVNNRIAGHPIAVCW